MEQRRTEEPNATALHLRVQLQELETERALAVADGLEGFPAYMQLLDDEIAAAHSAYVGLAVTEIATLRAELFGPQVG